MTSPNSPTIRRHSHSDVTMSMLSDKNSTCIFNRMRLRNIQPRRTSPIFFCRHFSITKHFLTSCSLRRGRSRFVPTVRDGSCGPLPSLLGRWDVHVVQLRRQPGQDCLPSLPLHLCRRPRRVQLLQALDSMHGIFVSTFV